MPAELIIVEHGKPPVVIRFTDMHYARQAAEQLNRRCRTVRCAFVRNENRKRKLTAIHNIESITT